MSDRGTIKTLKQVSPEIVALEVSDASVQHGIYSDTKDSVPSTPPLAGYPGVDSERPSTILSEGVFPNEFRNVALDFWIVLSDAVDLVKYFLLGHSRLLLPCHLDRDCDLRVAIPSHFTNAGLPAVQAPSVLLSRICVFGVVDFALALDFGWCSKPQFGFCLLVGVPLGFSANQPLFCACFGRRAHDRYVSPPFSSKTLE